jgi:hypothetical protein
MDSPKYLTAVSVMAQAVSEGDFAIQNFQFNSGETHGREASSTVACCGALNRASEN